ncbi:MAG: primosomal protein N', partial [Bradymonadia bacterium]
MSRFAEIAIPVPLRTTFHYRVPPRCSQNISPGQRVLVPFGSRKMVGYCVGITDEAPQGVDAKELIRIIDEDEPTFGPAMMSFVSFLADYYMAPIGEVMRSAH